MKHFASSPSDSVADLALLPADTATGAAGDAEVDVLALFDRRARQLLRYVESFDLGREDTEDVVQETFVALFRHLSLGRDRTNLTGWLFRVAHNLALKRHRTNRRQPAYRAEHLDLTGVQIDPGLDPEAQLVQLDRQRKLRAVVRALSDRDRRCLLLHAEGLTYRDIAAALRVSLGSVAKSLTRALARLGRADGG